AGLAGNHALISHAHPLGLIRKQLFKAVHGDLRDKSHARTPRCPVSKEQLQVSVPLFPWPVFLYVKDVEDKTVNWLVIRHHHADGLSVHILGAWVTGQQLTVNA